MTNRTYSGLPKPAGKSGHFYESRRHQLQAKGLKTGHHINIVINHYTHNNIDTMSLSKILARIPTESRREVFLKQFNSLSDNDKRFVIDILKDTDGDKAIDLYDCDPYDPTNQDLKEFIEKATEKVGQSARWLGQEAKLVFQKAKEGGNKALEWAKKEGKEIQQGYKAGMEHLKEEQAAHEFEPQILPPAPKPETYEEPELDVRERPVYTNQPTECRCPEPEQCEVPKTSGLVNVWSGEPVNDIIKAEQQKAEQKVLAKQTYYETIGVLK